MTQKIRDSYQAILQRISEATAAANRGSEEITLVVVTKKQPLPVIQAVVEAGATYLGENYADEALPKIQALSHLGNIKWHMIGHVQSRKARIVADHFSMVHSVDSLKLAEKLNRSCEEAQKKLPVLLELNLGGEESKSGWIVSNEADLLSLSSEIEQMMALPWLELSGLMTMPPLSSDPEDSRPYFRKLCQYRDVLGKRYPGLSWSELSMGTSVDFEVGIQEGATMVRVGQAILGPRP